jgi:hypothetical protein
MTTHELARILLKLDDLPAVSLDDYGHYVNIRSVFESELGKLNVGYIMPDGAKEAESFPVVIIT